MLKSLLKNSANSSQITIIEIIKEKKYHLLQNIFEDYLKKENHQLYDRYISNKILFQQNKKNKNHKLDQDAKKQNDLILSVAPYLDKFISEIFSIEKEIDDIKRQYNDIIINLPPRNKFINKVNQQNYLRQNKIDELSENIELTFNFRDQDLSRENQIFHNKYCIYCHKNNKDSCTHKIDNEKIAANNQNYLQGDFDKKFLQNNFISLEKFANKNGCPLGQKISLMHLLTSNSYILSALAVVVIDNPLVILTGHRICNDCMVSCIFQKQDAVNTPLSESALLDEVLNLPYGVEIYHLLTIWNPLNFDNILVNKYQKNEITNIKTNQGNNQSTILIVGSGPSAIAMSYYLLSSGHNIIMIDGMYINNQDLKNEALNCKIYKFYNDVKEDLSKVEYSAFGGIMSYGITSRWDKNKLKIAQIILSRYDNFEIYSPVRLGSNLSISQAFDIGFDHIILATGAGEPNLIPNNFNNRQASNILYAPNVLMKLLQNTRNINEEHKAPVLIKLPVVIIGLGLTAIDTAVEIINYYPLMLSNICNSNITNFNISDEERNEYLYHYSLIKNVKSDQEKIDIIHALGGVTILYKDKINKSSAYKNNFEEIEHALAHKVIIKEDAIFENAIINDVNKVTEINFSHKNIDESDDELDDKSGNKLGNKINYQKVNLKCNNLIIAIGTKYNEFIDLDEKNNEIYRDKIDIIGDANPKYHGTVVKAIASAKDLHKDIINKLEDNVDKSAVVNSKNQFINIKQDIENKLLAKLVKFEIINNEHIKFTILSEILCNNFRAGQFFKIYFNSSEFATISPIDIDRKNNMLSFILLDYNKYIKGQNIESIFVIDGILNIMGPTGRFIGDSICRSNNIVLIGHNRRNIQLLSIFDYVVDDIINKFNEDDIGDVNITYINIQNNQLNDKNYILISKLVRDKYIQNKNKINNKAVNNITIDYLESTNDIEHIKEHIAKIKNSHMFLAVDEDLLFGFDNHHHYDNSNHVIKIMNKSMNCMMKGICGECITKNDDGGYIFACKSQII